jgi:hypothetical protein
MGGYNRPKTTPRQPMWIKKNPSIKALLTEGSLLGRRRVKQALSH